MTHQSVTAGVILEEAFLILPHMGENFSLGGTSYQQFFKKMFLLKGLYPDINWGTFLFIRICDDNVRVLCINCCFVLFVSGAYWVYSGAPFSVQFISLASIYKDYCNFGPAPLYELHLLLPLIVFFGLDRQCF